jgi:hypothetical protein
MLEMARIGLDSMGAASERAEPETGNDDMKKMLLVALVGLSLTLGLEQQASAYCKFSFGVGFNVCFECGRNQCCPVDCCGPFEGGPDMGFAGPGPDVDGALPGAPPIAAPEPPGAKPVPNVMPRANYQPVGYFPQQPQGETPEVAAPSYWYGR